MIAYRHNDRRYPFLWETADQPGARWHRAGEGPAQYLADTPTGAWAEFLRHEEITDPADLAGISRALWVVDIEDEDFTDVDLPLETLFGGYESYHACQATATALREFGVLAIQAPSAALLPGGASGWRVDDGMRASAPAEGVVFVLFGSRPELIGWCVVANGRPPTEIVARVRHLDDRGEQAGRVS